MTRVLILGASSMLGSSLAPILRKAGYYVIRQSRSNGYDLQFDLLSADDWTMALSQSKPDVVINLAAATKVDLCEKDPQLAFLGNVAPLLGFIQASAQHDTKPHLLHISTDQVYDGSGPHSEGNVQPCNVYALSKHCAELVLSGYPSTIFRTNFFGLSRAPTRLSFSDWIIKSVISRSSITILQDVLFSPIHLTTLCEIIALGIERRIMGTFNVGSHFGFSKAEFANLLATRLSLPTQFLQLGKLDDLNLCARRPLDMRMNSSHFEDSFSFALPTLSNELLKAVNEYAFSLSLPPTCN